MFLPQKNNIQKKLIEQNLDGFLVSNFYNIFYLTGFKTLTKEEREAWLLLTKKKTYLFTDGRYVNNLKIKNQETQTNRQTIELITPEKGLIYHLEKIIKQEKIFQLGFEEEDLKVGELRVLKEKLPQVEFVSTERLIIKEREIKTTAEIKKIKKACLLADQCLKQIVKTIKPGQTEKEIGFKIEFFLKKRGFDLAFPSLVAIDENSAIPHYDTAANGRKKVKMGSLILIDFGANYEDYLSDMTRIVFFGKPKSEQINVYQKLLTIQQSTISNLKKVKLLKEADDYCRLLIADSQLPNYPHSTGHGVGLEIHEYPKISQRSKDRLRVNQVFTIEPGVYFPGRWGMRVEDTVLFDKDLRPYCLTKFPKSLIVV